MEALSKKAVGSFGWEAVARGGQQAATLLSTMVLARLLPPSAYGLAGMAAIFINFASTFSQLGIPGAIVQKAEVDDDLLSSLFWFNLAVGFLLSAALMACSPLAAMFFHAPIVRPVLSVLAWTFAINSFGNIQHALFYRSMSLRKPAIAQIASSLSAFAVAAVMAWKGYGVWSLVISNVVSRIVDSLLMWGLHPWRPGFIMRWAHFRAVSNFGLNLSAFGIVNYFARNGDNLIVGRALGSADLGYYQNAFSLMYYPQQLITSLVSNVLLSPLSRVQKEAERFRAAALRLARFMGIVLFPISFGQLVTCDLVIAVALGPKWRPAVPIFAVLTIAGSGAGLFSAVGQIMAAKGRADLMVKYGIISTVTSLVCFLIGVHWGAIGVATGCAIAGVSSILPLVAVLRLIGLTLGAYLRALAPVISSSLGMALTVGLWRLALNAVQVHSLWLVTGSSVVLGAAAYFSFLTILCPALLRDLIELFAHSVPALRFFIRLPGLRKAAAGIE